MPVNRLLIANRGEIAIRIMRTAAEMGISTVAVFSEDDARSLHTRRADEARPLRGRGSAAYIDAEQIIAIASEAGCDAIHPGYGFLSEDAAFARRCIDAGTIFVGPRPEILELFGDKGRARAFAESLGVPVLRGTSALTTLDDARAFLASLGAGGAIMIKAVAGGGGRGMRAVHDADELADAFARCQSEARSAFGSADVYVEQLLQRARHIEVQIIGDGSGEVSHLGERDCTAQRRTQKLVEIAPSPHLPAALRDRLTSAAVRMASEARFDNIGTFEFLLDGAREIADDTPFSFIEANPRLQVEHTITEEVTGIDLVRTQLHLAAEDSLAELRLQQAGVPAPRGLAMQLRINMESMRPDGSVKPSGGTIAAFEAPAGPGVRVDSFAYAGYVTSPAFDSLLAKLIAHSPTGSFEDVIARARRALSEFRIEGIDTNIGFLQKLLEHPEFAGNGTYTRFIDDHVAELTADRDDDRAYPFDDAPDAARSGFAGARIDEGDPLAVLHHGKSAHRPGDISRSAADVDVPAGTAALRAPIQGTIIAIDVHEGDVVRGGQQLFVMESMKMEHVVKSESAGRIQRIAVALGDTVFEGHPLALLEPAAGAVTEVVSTDAVDLDEIRPDLAEVHERHAVGLDEARPDAVARRRKTHQRTARENIDDLCDEGSFVEYGPLVLAAQRRRRSVEELIKQMPADGLVAGIGRVNGDLFGDETARCIAMSYDYTVLAGTQGAQNHRKKDRMFELAEKWRLPIVVFTEGGGGRPGDTDGLGVAGLDCMAFNYFRQAQRSRAAHRHHVGPLLRRQRRPPGLLRCRHRNARLEHRHGRPGDGRGRRPRRLPAGGDRPARRAGAQRRR